ncbi:MAG: nucleoside hydrolase [Candidatus Methylacidiphilales bacterium]
MMISSSPVAPLTFRPRAVLDTDTYNEVDDQFALAHLLLSQDRVQFEEIYAAPFHNSRSQGPDDGMERSYDEIMRVLKLLERVPNTQKPVYRGSRQFMDSADKPVESEAARRLVEIAMAPSDAPGKLYVVAIGACTNVASAILMEPAITEKIVVVWLGGNSPYWPSAKEFNLQQDLHAVRVLLDKPVPLVLVPCHPVASHMQTTVAELEKHLAPYSKLGEYLTDIVRHHHKNEPGWSKVIWDMAATAWLMDPGWLPTEEKPSPVLLDDMTWQLEMGRRTISIAKQVHRDPIFADFYAKCKALGDLG